MENIFCQSCGAENDRDARFCKGCGNAMYSGGGYAQPPLRPEGDVTGGIIPYKNPCALISYYMGIFSIIPILGILLSIPAVILGIMGILKRKKNPEVKGLAHAIIGIVAGAIFTILWVGCIILIAVNR